MLRANSVQSELVVLKGFGPTLCARLTKKLQEYCDAEGLPMPEQYKKRRKSSDVGGEDEGDDGEDEPAPKKVRKTKPYVPILGSGAYAIVMALSTLGEDHLGWVKVNGQTFSESCAFL